MQLRRPGETARARLEEIASHQVLVVSQGFKTCSFLCLDVATKRACRETLAQLMKKRIWQKEIQQAGCAQPIPGTGANQPAGTGGVVAAALFWNQRSKQAVTAVQLTMCKATAAAE